MFIPVCVCPCLCVSSGVAGPSPNPKLVSEAIRDRVDDALVVATVPDASSEPLDAADENDGGKNGSSGGGDSGGSGGGSADGAEPQPRRRRMLM